MTQNLNIFFKEVYAELLKIIWPSRKEFFLNVLFTFIVVFLFSVYLGLADALISYVVSKIICYFV